MATATYTALLTRIADMAARSDIDTLIPDWIGDFEAKANRWMRERRMQGRSTASVNAEFSELPTDYAETISLSLATTTETWKIDAVPPAVLESYALEDVTGRPRLYAVVGTELRFFPVPDQAYTATLNYFTKLDALSGSQATNWLLTDAPDAYVQGVMAGFHEWDQNYPASDRAMAKAEQIFTELMMARRTPSDRLRVDPAMQSTRRLGYDINTDI